MEAITEREIMIASENLRYLRQKFHIYHSEESEKDEVRVDYPYMDIPMVLEEVAILLDRLQKERSEYYDRLDFLLKQCMK